MSTYCFNQRRYFGSKCHALVISRDLAWSASENCGHVNIRKTRRVTFLCIPILWSSAVTFCSFHAMASTVIYYSIYARQNEIYLFNTSNVLCIVRNNVIAHA